MSPMGSTASPGAVVESKPSRQPRVGACSPSAARLPDGDQRQANSPCPCRTRGYWPLSPGRLSSAAPPQSRTGSGGLDSPQFNRSGKCLPRSQDLRRPRVCSSPCFLRAATKASALASTRPAGSRWASAGRCGVTDARWPDSP